MDWLSQAGIADYQQHGAGLLPVLGEASGNRFTFGQPQIQAVCASFSCSISLAKTWAQSPLEAPLGLQCPLGNSRHATTDVWGQVTVVCLIEASGR